MSAIVRYWHTLRYLRPVQFYGRAWFRLARPKPDMRPPPRRRYARGAWTEPARRKISLTGPREFLFLGVAGGLDDIGWNGPQREKLWRYNQHYFDDLNAENAVARQHWHEGLLADWIAGNPPGRGDGWEPYPTSLRIVNWVKWANAGNETTAAFLHGLAIQVRWLTRRLEHHLLGNHLFANAKALVIAGSFFEGNEADTWRNLGLGILQREFSEQILSDGGHFERSPMYHALALEDVLDLLAIARRYPGAMGQAEQTVISLWEAAASRMLSFLLAMSHPDGQIAFFNDAAFDVSPTNLELCRYAERLGITQSGESLTGPRWMKQSGYVRLEHGQAVALFDMAPVGPDYLPGHAHADTLSFEFSLGTYRIWVNSGTGCYGASKERLRQRGTAAHNTVVYDGRDSSEVWGGFRVARRARPVGARVWLNDLPLKAACAHDGYVRTGGGPLHERTWELGHGHLTVIDRLVGAAKPAQARFHAHPTLAPSLRLDGDGGGVTLPDGRTVRWQVEVGKQTVEDSTWHPRFGESLDSRCLVVELVDGESRVRFEWD